MPDLRTALENALQKAATIPAWDDEGSEPAPIQTVDTTKEQAVSKKLFPVTNNVSRETHQYILANPGQTRAQIIKAMEAKGYKEKSVGALISNMFYQKMLSGDQATGLYAVYNEYRPIKTFRLTEAERREAEAAARAAKRKGMVVAQKPDRKKVVVTVKPRTQRKVEEKPAVVATPTPVPVPTLSPAGWTAQKFLEGLPVLQAKAVYDELKKLFG